MTDTTDTSTQDTNTQDVASPEDKPQGRTFTQDELNEIISKEKAKVKASYEREQEKRAKQEAEAKELERLEGEARLRKEWEIKERELTEARDRAQRDLAVSNVRAELSRMGYSGITEIAPTLIGKDEDATKENVVNFDRMVQRIVAEKVSAGLNRGAPPDPSTSRPAGEDISEARRAMGLK